MASIDNIQGGAFQDPGGNVLNGGSIVFRLSSPAQTINDGQAVPDIPIVFALNSSGSVPSGSALYGNDQLTPNGTYYIVNVYNALGALARGPENWVISGISPIDLGGIAASSPSISYPLPIPREVAVVSLTGQAAAIATTALYTPSVVSRFRISWCAKVTTPATTTSSLGPLTIYITDQDYTSLTIPMPHFSGLSGGLKGGGASSGGNGLNTTMLGLPAMVTAVGSIFYSFGYASAGATAMQYELSIIVEEC